MPQQTAAPHVLVVDDEPDLRTLYELTLLREGYRVDAAATLEESWQAAAAKPLRCGDHRHAAARRTRAGAAAPDDGAPARPERVVVMTAYGSAENAVDALKAGAFDYLTKPVDLKQFRSAVASAIQESGTPERQPRRRRRRAARGRGFGGAGPRRVGAAAARGRVPSPCGW